ncbi:hypothetical protein I4641_13145 [Waterburya agarophytonicola K14]|uniref:DUF7305 domain-containing protein n=1 Tax=Waterburya agarophytonicola KI4 TaxID=2874699 RepID=A0A964FFL4_9CYAN|nr:hypothetical protein [Waterburya agarophytonicola]MCC0177925.1 hypothetical protein [Waterburya agarophytonicola KI4]
MKLLLYRVLLQRRARDEGFTLPLVIGLGLVMTLLGTINLTSANEEKLNALTQNSRSDALAIAEIGVTRYRELLDKNRILAINDSTAWTGIGELCEGNIANFFEGQSNDITLAEDGLELNNDGDTTDTFIPGSYQLVSYDYVGAANFDVTSDAANNDPVSGNPATGILTVRGTTPDGQGNAQIVVDIPIRINTSDMDNLAPALWVGDDTVTSADLGTLTVNNGNIVIQDTAVTTSGSEADGCGDFATLATATGLPIISDARGIPSIQPIIDTITSAGGQVNTTVNTASEIVGSTSELPYTETWAGANFNQSVDCADIRDCRYYYNLGGQTFNNDVKADGIARVTMYIDGTLNINAPAGGINIGSNAASNYFEIYVDNGQAITINTGGNDVTIDAFIHAPESTLTINGSGTVTINGSVWVNDFINNSATVNITPDLSSISSSASDRAYKFYTTTTNRTPKPITERPSNWRTEEFN